MSRPDDTAHLSRVVAPGRAPFPTRGAACQRILALLREYPEGLTAAELRVLLGAEKSLTDTCAGMFKDGLLRRVRRGRYVTNDPADALTSHPAPPTHPGRSWSVWQVVTSSKGP